MLRTHKLGEADRIITMLSRRHGKVRAVAKGVRRTTSKFGARLEPFSHIDLQFATGRSLDVVTQVESLDAFGEPLTEDYPAYTAGEVMLETADRLVVEEREPALQQYLLLVAALRALNEGTSDGPRPATLILDSYLLRSLAIAGYAPSFADCARCGLEGPHSAFSPAAGGRLPCRAQREGDTQRSCEQRDEEQRQHDGEDVRSSKRPVPRREVSRIGGRPVRQARRRVGRKAGNEAWCRIGWVARCKAWRKARWKVRWEARLVTAPHAPLTSGCDPAARRGKQR